MSNEPSNQGRRSALRVLTAAGGGVAAAATLGPVLSAVVDPATKTTVSGTGRFVSVIDFDAVPEDGSPVRVPVVVQAPKDGWNLLPPTEVGSVWLHRNEGEVTAFSTICPHLGCAIDWEGETERYICPCHDTYFGKDGSVGTGPSPRPMDSLETRVVERRVEVKFEKFALNVREKRIV